MMLFIRQMMITPRYATLLFRADAADAAARLFTIFHAAISLLMPRHYADAADAIAYAAAYGAL